MIDFDWKSELLLWSVKHQIASNFQADLVAFFLKVFQNTVYPEKSYFGHTSKSISLIIGGIYLGAYYDGKGEEGGIWLLSDKQYDSKEGFSSRVVLSTLKSKRQLYWINIEYLRDLNKILDSKEVWESFRNASFLVVEHSIHRKNTDENKIRGKHKLSSFFSGFAELNAETITTEHAINGLQNQNADTVEGIRKIEEKMRELTPKVKEEISTYIERGQIAKEVKKLTGFKCLVCEQLGFAPLSFKKPDGEYYVETHHIEPVSKLLKGSLGLTNLITVCANHHRQLHYGDVEVTQFEKHFELKIDEKVLKINRLTI